jgi:hypothetical protein
VDLPRPSDAEVRIAPHLEPLRDPARQAPEREHHREHVGRDAHRLVDGAGTEVDVGVELAFGEVLVAQGDLLELAVDAEQVRRRSAIDQVLDDASRAAGCVRGPSSARSSRPDSGERK